jgi:hypothetical protein
MGEFLTKIGVVCAIIVLIAVPGTYYFSADGKQTIIWTLAAIAAVAIGTTLSRFLIQAGNVDIKKKIQLPEPTNDNKNSDPLTWTSRVVIVLIGILVVGVMLVPANLYTQGESSIEPLWIIAAVASLALGITITHWLYQQGELSPEEIKQLEIIESQDNQFQKNIDKSPPYWKWMTLSSFLAVAIIVITTTGIADDHPWLYFTACALALGLGILLAYLASIKIDDIEPLPETLKSEIEHEIKPATPAIRLVSVIFLGGAAIALVIVPTSTFFGTHGEHTSLSFFASIAAIFIGIGIGIWLLHQSLASAEKIVAQTEQELQLTPIFEKRTFPAWTKHLFLLVGIGLAFFVTGVPASQYFEGGQSYTYNWFLAAMAAIIAGALIGNWIELLGTAAAKYNEQHWQEFPKFTLPPWFKWISLLILLAILTIVAINTSDNLYFEGSSSTWQWILSSGSALIGGTGLGIWFSHRFDEMAEEASRIRRQRIQDKLKNEEHDLREEMDEY